jgi:hypothetical protein
MIFPPFHMKKGPRSVSRRSFHMKCRHFYMKTPPGASVSATRETDAPVLYIERPANYID